MNRLLSFALFIVAGCMFWGCNSETQNPVSSDAPARGELTALHMTSPNPPGNLLVTIVGHIVTITWTPPQGTKVLGYHVVVSSSDGGTYNNIIDTVATQRVLIDVPVGSYNVWVSGILGSPNAYTPEATTNFTISGVLPPTVTVTASPIPLCPRNGKWVIVNFTGIVSNSEGGASYELKDENSKIRYTGTVGAGQYSVKLKLKDRRKGSDKDGMQYTFTITATNSAVSASASVVVTVPRDKKPRN